MMKYLLVLFILLSGCNRNDESPEFIIREVVKLQFKNEMTKGSLNSFFSSELVNEFEQLGPEVFSQAFSMQKKRLTNLKIESEKCTDLTCSLIYIINYKEIDDSGKESSEISVKKLAQFKKVDSKSKAWRISNLSDLKTYIDFKEELSL